MVTSHFRPSGPPSTAPGKSTSGGEKEALLLERLPLLVERAKKLDRAGYDQGAEVAASLIERSVQMLVAHARTLPPKQAQALRQTLLTCLSAEQTRFGNLNVKPVVDRARALVATLPDQAARPKSDFLSRITGQRFSQQKLSGTTRSQAPSPALATAPKNKVKRLIGQAKQLLVSTPKFTDEPVGHPSNVNGPNSVKVPLRVPAHNVDPALTRLHTFVDVRVHGQQQLVRKPFRMSLVESEGHPTLLVGSSIASGGFGKVVPILYRDSSGQLVEAVGKIVRLEAPRNLATKSRTNRFGQPRNRVATNEKFEYEQAQLERAGGPVKVLGSRSYGNVRLLIMTSMDMSLAEATTFLQANEVSSFSRDSLAQLAKHYKDHIHKKNLVHGDGKSLNALVNFSRGIAAVSDFGDTKEITPQANRVSPVHTFFSPEVTLGNGLSFAHDIFCLGLTGLSTLSRNGANLGLFQLSRYPDGKIDAQRSRQKLEEFTTFQRSVLKDPDKGNEVDRSKLRQALMYNSNVTAAFRQAYIADPELTVYILGSLMHPLEERRPTSEQAAKELSRLAAKSALKASKIYESLEARTMGTSRAREAMLSVASVML